METKDYFQAMVDKEASDLYFSVGSPVSLKLEGTITPLLDERIKPGEVREIAYSIMSREQIDDFEKTMESNFGKTIYGVGRFRVNVFRQRGEVSMVVRHVKTLIPSMEELQLPPVLKDLVMEPRGLVLVVGATGTGKSTTLASMIDYRNQGERGHILTIEDPIEYMYKSKESIVNQREVGIDTESYHNALMNAVREAPDVILIGEIRDRETMQMAMSYSDTGHLCLATLHANNADQTMDRIVNFFPIEAHEQLLMDISVNLKAIISQRLVKGVDGRRLPAVEVLINTPFISELIQKGEIKKIKSAMAEGTDPNLQTFDQDLFRLYQAGRITKETAIDNADSRNDLTLKIRFSAEEEEAVF